MNLNEVIQVERPTVSALVNGLRTEQLFVDSTFQRKLVWTEKQKVRLIETILIGCPMPEIYLWQQPANPDTGSQRRSVVDGQQRLTSMLQFASNEWTLKSKYLDAENQGSDFANSNWKGLPEKRKKQFWDYVVNSRIIPNAVDLDQIVSIFKRLNETDKSLNPQEIRNAEFNGELITAAESITNNAFFSKFDVFPPSQIRRMADIEFGSSMLIYLRRGSIEEKKEIVNDMYDLYNDVYEEKSKDLRTVSMFFEFLDDAISREPVLEDLFTKSVHIFTLFCAYVTLRARRKTGLLSIPALVSFAKAYRDGSTDERIEDYRKAAQARTRSKLSRDSRLSALLKWVDPD